MTEATPETGTEATEGQQGGTWTPPASQAELDRLIAERLSRQKAQFSKQLEGVEELRAKAAKFDEAEEARKSTEQKLHEAAQAAEARAQAAVDRAVRAEVKAIATGEFAEPGDAHLYLGDLSRFVTKNGDVDSAAIEEALKEVEKTRPHLVAHARTDVGLGARGGTSAPDMNNLLRQAAGR